MTAQELRDLQTAIERVFSGDMSIEAGCVADALEDLGWAGLRARRSAGEQPLPFPEASTRGLPKKRSA